MVNLLIGVGSFHKGKGTEAGFPAGVHQEQKEKVRTPQAEGRMHMWDSISDWEVPASWSHERWIGTAQRKWE